MEKTRTTDSGAEYCLLSDMSGVSADVVSMPLRWMRENSSLRRTQQSLTADQLTSLSAMIAYISLKSGQSEFRLERSLADRFHVANAKCLPANDFDSAIRYLADIDPA